VNDQLNGVWGSVRRGCSSMVERELPKLNTRVRFPSPAFIIVLVVVLVLDFSSCQVQGSITRTRTIP
jgi:hypothetical protein